MCWGAVNRYIYLERSPTQVSCLAETVVGATAFAALQQRRLGVAVVLALALRRLPRVPGAGDNARAAHRPLPSRPPPPARRRAAGTVSRQPARLAAQLHRPEIARDPGAHRRPRRFFEGARSWTGPTWTIWHRMKQEILLDIVSLPVFHTISSAISQEYFSLMDQTRICLIFRCFTSQLVCGWGVLTRKSQRNKHKLSLR